jgi:hypothetical protein
VAHALLTVLKKENCTVSAKTQTRINVLYAIDEASVMVLNPPKTPSGGVSWVFSAPSLLRAVSTLMSTPLLCQDQNVKLLRYIELKSGYNDDGPAWIGYVTPSKSGRTIYFNGRALMKRKGHRRGEAGGNYCDMETSESFWVSGVKKNCQDRHRCGFGKILIEATAVSEYLEAIGVGTVDKSLHEITHTIVQTDIRRFEQIANASCREATFANG